MDKYLGDNLDANGWTKEQISNRIKNTEKIFYALGKILLSKKRLSERTKINLYNAVGLYA